MRDKHTTTRNALIFLATKVRQIERNIYELEQEGVDYDLPYLKDWMPTFEKLLDSNLK